MTKHRDQVWRLALPTPMYVAVMLAAWVIQSLWIPRWLVSSHAGLQTLVQTLPATLIALFALAFATLFVAIQQVTNTFSSRAPLILASDARVLRIVARTVMITASSLILGAITPDTKSMPSYLTAAGATLVIASAWLVYSYGRFAYLLIIDYSTPRSFADHVVSPVRNRINKKKYATGYIVFRVPLLGQTLRYALSRDDIETLHASLEGLQELQKICVDAALHEPSIRDHQLGEGNVRQGWLADELRRIYAGGCEQALRSQTPQEEIDLIVDHFANATRVFINGHQQSESKDMMTGLARIATTPYQVTPFATNFMPRPASALASLEKTAENADESCLAKYALANWAVAIFYPQYQFMRVHPLFAEGARSFGEHAPWTAAIELASDPNWYSQWVNKFESSADQLASILRLARDYSMGAGTSEHRRRKISAYAKWLNITENIASDMVGAGSGPSADFMRRLEEANQAIHLFGSSAVQSSSREYFDSFGEILTEIQGLSNLPDVNERRTAIISAINSRPIANARAKVLDAMNAELGTSWREDQTPE